MYKRVRFAAECLLGRSASCRRKREKPNFHQGTTALHGGVFYRVSFFITMKNPLILIFLPAMTLILINLYVKWILKRIDGFDVPIQLSFFGGLI